MPHDEPIAKESGHNLERRYRAITRHTDGRIIHVRDLLASSDAEAVQIVTARGSDFRMDLWSELGLVQRFGPDAM